MAKAKPNPDPRPTDGGSYLLDEATGQWICNNGCPLPPPPEPAVIEADHAPADA
jgi:hypothetical protein